MLIVAYTRLSLLSECANGSKLMTIMSCGQYDIRLAEVPTTESKLVRPLWIELYDRSIERGDRQRRV